MDHSRPAAGGGRERPAGERAEVDRGLRARVVVADLDEPLGGRAEDPQLIDRLAGADVSQLGRSVGAQHEQWDPRLARLDHGGEEVGGRRPRGGGDCHGTPARLGQAEGEEAGRALVEYRPRPQPPLAGERQRQRGVARAGAGDRVRQPAADQLVHEGLDRGVGPVDWDHREVSQPPTVVLVPGFTQHGEAWDAVAARLGQRYRCRPLDPSTQTWVDRLAELREAARTGAALAGYSMGGRLVLHAVLAEPDRYAAVVTVGAAAGIEDPRARAERRRADARLADWIGRQPIEAVVERWERRPIFATQSSELVAAQRPGRLAHDPADLARLLHSAGQGALEPVWDRLRDLPTPLLAIAGERDHDYARAAERMAALAPAGEAALVAGAGHAAHLERPDRVARLIEGFLDRTTGPPPRPPRPWGRPPPR
jgi:2-succinyl-6-hydroxy-2,4-cyclohexadiene-1-carboxylate synthase